MALVEWPEVAAERNHDLLALLEREMPAVGVQRPPDLTRSRHLPQTAASG